MSEDAGSTPIERIELAHAAALPRLRGGPAWARRRSAALERLLAHGLPDRRDENWKYLDWTEIGRRGFHLREAPVLAGGQLAPLLLGLPAARRIVLTDGQYDHALSSAVSGDGIAVESLAAAVERDPEGVAQRLRTPGDDADDRFALLAEAFTNDGLLIRIADGASEGEMLYVVHVSTGATPAASHSRILIEAGRGSSARLVEHFVSVNEGADFSNLAAEIRIADGALLEHLRLHQRAADAVQVETVLVRQARDSRYTQRGFVLGGRIVRSNLHLRLEGPGAEAGIHGLFMVDGSRQADLYTLIEHAAARTRSVQVFRGVATDRGRGAFNGRIVVHEGAPKTDAQQSSRNLILSPLAEINARPQLEILTDDVKCSHGATTGSLDANQLFYLLSRGIDPETARGLLTFAFCEDVVAGVADPALRRHLEELVVGRLPDRDIIKEFV